MIFHLNHFPVNAVISLDSWIKLKIHCVRMCNIFSIHRYVTGCRGWFCIMVIVWIHRYLCSVLTSLPFAYTTSAIRKFYGGSRSGFHEAPPPWLQSWLHYEYLHEQCGRAPLPEPSLASVVIWFLDDIHSEWGETDSQDSFNSYFPGAKDSEHISNIYWPFNLPLRTRYSLAHVLTKFHFLLFKFLEFSIDSRYKILIRCIIDKDSLPFCGLSHHSGDFSVQKLLNLIWSHW